MIVVAGSINVDLVASVNALPRAGETVLSDSYRRLPGGKGANQALAARRAGAEVELVGNVGNDEHSAVALEELLRAGVGLDRITKSSKPTGIAMIAVDRSAENQIVVAAGANGTVSPSTLDDRLLESANLLVLQLEIEPEVSLRVAQRAQALGTPVLLNAAPARPLDEGMFRTLDYLVVNELELEAIANSLEIAPDEVERRLVALAANADLVAHSVVAEPWRAHRAESSFGVPRCVSIRSTPQVQAMLSSARSPQRSMPAGPSHNRSPKRSQRAAWPAQKRVRSRAFPRAQRSTPSWAASIRKSSVEPDIGRRTENTPAESCRRGWSDQT